jgi:nucleoside-diphosphate kinase
MALERTLTIIKPDAVEGRHAGHIINVFEVNEFRIVASRLVRLSRLEAEGFYDVHRDKPFFHSLTTFMSSGPAIVMVLERDNAIPKLREIMGATDPAKASLGSIRKMYGRDIEHNAVHGSDSPQTAAYEIGYFFPGVELV